MKGLLTLTRPPPTGFGKAHPLIFDRIHRSKEALPKEEEDILTELTLPDETITKLTLIDPLADGDVCRTYVS